MHLAFDTLVHPRPTSPPSGTTRAPGKTTVTAAGKEGDLIGIAGDAFANSSDIVCRFGDARAPA